MSPEELDRTIDFIIQSQARLAIAQERDRERRIELQTLTTQVVKLIDHQSNRLDRQDAFYRDSLRQNAELQRQNSEFQRQALNLLHMILDRLPPGLPAT
jgi:hypothetical protein